jgi:hypothetical protein
MTIGSTNRSRSPGSGRGEDYAAGREAGTGMTRDGASRPCPASLTQYERMDEIPFGHDTAMRKPLYHLYRRGDFPVKCLITGGIAPRFG